MATTTQNGAGTPSQIVEAIVRGVGGFVDREELNYQAERHGLGEAEVEAALEPLLAEGILVDDERGLTPAEERPAGASAPGPQPKPSGSRAGKPARSPRFKEKTCQRCGETFTPKSGAAKRCPSCRSQPKDGREAKSPGELQDLERRAREEEAKAKAAKAKAKPASRKRGGAAKKRSRRSRPGRPRGDWYRERSEVSVGDLRSVLAKLEGENPRDELIELAGIAASMVAAIDRGETLEFPGAEAGEAVRLGRYLHLLEALRAIEVPGESELARLEGLVAFHGQLEAA